MRVDSGLVPGAGSSASNPAIAGTFRKGKIMENENIPNEEIPNEEIPNIESIAASIDALEVDNNANQAENIGDGDGLNLKNPDIAAMQETITEQAKKIEQITKQLGRMVKLYGARISEEQSTVEEFKSLKVENTFDDSVSENVPSLDEIKLG